MDRNPPAASGSFSLGDESGNRGRSPSSLNRVRERAREFQFRISRRNTLEYSVAGVLLAVFAISAFYGSGGFSRSGALLMAVAAAFVIFHLHERGSARRVPDCETFADCAAFHQAELQRQRDLLRGIWWWYLLPFVPGLAFFIYGVATEGPDLAEQRIAAFITGAFCVIVFVAVGRMNRSAAAKLQREIDELGSPTPSPGNSRAVPSRQG